MHKHQANTTETRPFFGPVSRHENLAAHGNICLVQRCTCGAERKVNVNGSHTEQGAWR